MIGRKVGSRVGRWFDDRLGLARTARSGAAKVFPEHWSFMLGEIALYSFGVLLVTGMFLSLFFEPSTSERLYEGSYGPLSGDSLSAAYASAVELSWDVPAGLLMRQAHHWAALIFVGAIVLHLCRVFFTGAFRRPRELNWVVGVTLLLLAILNGFVGYSLVDDLLSGTGLRIAHSILLSVPLVGPWATFLAFGGEFPGEQIIPRLYALHVLLVPALILALVVVHMAVLVRQKHTDFPGPGRRESAVVGSRMWPGYALRSLSLLFAVGAVVFLLGGLVQINPVWLVGPYDPTLITVPAQPDWYLGWVDGSLRLFPPWDLYVGGYLVSGLFLSGVLLPTVVFLLMYAWPWLDRRLTGDRDEHHTLDRPRAQPLRVAVGVYALTFCGLLLVSGGDDLWARALEVSVLGVLRVMQVLVLVVPVVAAVLAWWLARRLRDSGAERLSTMTAGELVPRDRGGRRPDGGRRR